VAPFGYHRLIAAPALTRPCGRQKPNLPVSSSDQRPRPAETTCMHRTARFPHWHRTVLTQRPELTAAADVVVTAALPTRTETHLHRPPPPLPPLTAMFQTSFDPGTITVFRRVAPSSPAQRATFISRCAVSATASLFDKPSALPPIHSHVVHPAALL